MKRTFSLLFALFLWGSTTGIGGCHNAELEKLQKPGTDFDINPPAPPIACTVENETYIMEGKCCAGLQPLALNVRPQPDGTCPVFIDYMSEPMVCTACGNKQCGLGENKCNCPTDCLAETPTPPTPLPPEVCLKQGEQIHLPFDDGTLSREEVVNFCCEGLSQYILDATSQFVYIECRIPEAGKDCVNEFYLYNYDVAHPDQNPQCCAGLRPTLLMQRIISQDGINNCPAIPESYPPPIAEACSACGDGACGIIENDCNCPDDCSGAKPRTCLQNNESIQVRIGGRGSTKNICCEGLADYVTDITENKMTVTCRTPNQNTTCLDEFQVSDYISDTESRAIGCCEELQSITIEEDVTEDSQCKAYPAVFPPPYLSACSTCGDGTCGPIENICNCREDCPIE